MGGGQLHKNVFDGKNVKPNVKLRSIRMAVLTVQKIIKLDSLSF